MMISFTHTVLQDQSQMQDAKTKNRRKKNASTNYYNILYVHLMSSLHDDVHCCCRRFATQSQHPTNDGPFFFVHCSSTVLRLFYERYPLQRYTYIPHTTSIHIFVIPQFFVLILFDRSNSHPPLLCAIFPLVHTRMRFIVSRCLCQYLERT